MERTCLIVDDDLTYAHGLALLLERSGFVVVGLASNCLTALAVAQAECPEIAVVDVRLRWENGVECARRLAATPSVHPPVVILTSAFGSPPDLGGETGGANSFAFVPKNELSPEAIMRLAAG